MPQKSKPRAAVAAAGGAHQDSSNITHYNVGWDSWDSYRDAQDAAAARRAVLEEKLLGGAAAGLDFIHDDYGRFWLKCPHCGQSLRLGITKDGDICAYGFATGSNCAALPSIQRWLRDAGFANGGPRKKHPDNESIWDECRRALDAEAAKLKVAAARLGFTWTANGVAARPSFAPNGEWVRKCNCGGEMVLFTRDGKVRVGEWDAGPTCFAIEWMQWLCDAGFALTGESR